jgi:hypothetical protein
VGPEELYDRLAGLAASVPDFRDLKRLVTDPNMMLWLGRLTALIEDDHNVADLIKLRSSVSQLGGPSSDSASTDIVSVLYRALARAELSSGASSRTSVVQGGNVYDAYVAVGKVLRELQGEVMIADLYLDGTFITDFAPSLSPACRIKLLTTRQGLGTLEPAARRWAAQFGRDRPLEIRIAPKAGFHDRAIMDSKFYWCVSQSFHSIANKHFATILRLDGENAQLGRDAYVAVWDNAEPLEYGS